MKKLLRIPLVALAFVLQAVAPSGNAASALTTSAQSVIGQPHLLSNILNEVTDSSLFFPYDMARDQSVSQTRFFVADTYNSRVLGIECQGGGCQVPSFSAADRVFGQPDFTTYNQNGGLLGGVSSTALNFPRGVAVDSAGTLFVADTANNRVLVFWSAWDDAAADLVIGQPSFSSSAPGSGLNQLRAPEGVHYDAATGSLWVADTGNNRVLRFSSIATGASATLAIGGAGAAAAGTLSGPRDLLTDGAGGLYVADTGFSRVLRYAPPLAGGMAAATVFGHGGSMTNGSANHGGVGAGSLAYPEKIHLDPNGRLWVADTGNNRVLEYDNPLGSQTASRVFGQASRSQVPRFTTNTNDAPDGVVNAAGLYGPRGMAFDSLGTFWVCDWGNSRILGFESPLAAQTAAAITADLLLGKPDFVSAYANLPSQRRMNNPTGVAVDRSSSPSRLWVVDMGNSRVLGYDSTALASNRLADVVLGQPGFTDGSTNAGINGALQNVATMVASAGSLFYPFGVAVDSLGGVYVADSSNSRVLQYADPFANDALADKVFGQTNFASRNPFYPFGTAGSLAGAGGVSIGPDDALWVADTMDHRVVRFDNAPAAPPTGSQATLVLGQSGFTSGTTFPPYAPVCSASRMNSPRGVYAAPSQRVYVADSGNNRVLVFAPPFSNGKSASAIFGQSSFTSCAPNRGGAAGAGTLSNPTGVFEDATGRVFIADAYNNRVLVYDAPFSGGDLTADYVIGQPNFTSTFVSNPLPATLAQPESVAMDESGNLFVADRENSRVTRLAVDGPAAVVLDPLANPLLIGGWNAFTGSGFTPGSVVVVFVATSTGSTKYGPYPVHSQTAGSLIWFLPEIPAGAGFATVQVINTDQGFIGSNWQGQLLYGSAERGLPTIMAVNGVALNPADPSVPVANISVVVPQNSVVTIDGTGFSSPVLVLFSSDPASAVMEPLPGGTSTRFQALIPAGVPTGPGVFRVVNRPTFRESGAVSTSIGKRISLASVSQTGTTVTVTGEGFSTLTVISLFNRHGTTVVDLGGLTAGGQPKIPLTLVSSQMFTFQVPADAQTGAAFVQALNPPFIAFSSSGNSPNGGFIITQP
jgi:sugar lactone lactonase YvrE